MPMTSLAMAKVARLRPGTPAYDENLERLRLVNDAAKVNYLSSGARPLAEAFDEPGMGPQPGDTPLILPNNARIENMRARGAVAEGGLAAEQGALSAAQVDLAQQTTAADAAEAEAARVGRIADTGFDDPNSPAARSAKAQALIGSAEGGRIGRENLSAQAAAMNHIKAEELAGRNLDFQTQQDFSTDTMGRVMHEGQAAKLKALTGGGPITVGPGDERTTRWVGQGAGHMEVVPGGPPVLGPNGEVIAEGTAPTVRFVPAGPDLATQARMDEGINQRTAGNKARLKAITAQGDLAALAPQAAQADVVARQQANEIVGIHLTAIKANPQAYVAQMNAMTAAQRAQTFSTLAAATTDLAIKQALERAAANAAAGGMMNVQDLTIFGRILAWFGQLAGEVGTAAIQAQGVLKR